MSTYFSRKTWVIAYMVRIVDQDVPTALPIHKGYIWQGCMSFFPLDGVGQRDQVFG